MGNDVPRFWRSAGPSIDALHRQALRESELYHRTGDVTALRRARDLHRRVVDATSDDTPGRDVHLRNLAHAEAQLYEHTRDLPTLARAIDGYRHAVGVAPGGHPYREVYLYGLGRALRRLHHHTGELAPLEEAADMLRRCVALPPAMPGERAAQLGGLAEALGELYGLDGGPERLREAVAAQRRALDHTPPESPDRLPRLINLASFLSGWYEVTRERAALDEAVDGLRRARDELLRNGGTEPWQLAANLAGVLTERFRLDGRLDELDEAVALLRHVVEADFPLDDFERLLMPLKAAALALLRAEHSGEVRWADWAVRTLGETARTLPREDPNHDAVLLELGKAHGTRYGLSDDPADLESAIGVLGAALDVAGGQEESAENARAAAAELASQLARRHDRTGAPADLDRAIALQQDAVLHVPRHSPNFATLHAALGQTLLQRFRTRNDLGDLDRCADHLHRALAALPPHAPDRSAVLSTLGSAQLARYEHTGHRPHLHEAVDTQRAALDACPAGDVQRPFLLGNLALLLRLRHDAVGVGTADLDEAVGLLRQVLALRHGASGAGRITLLELAEALRSRADAGGGEADLTECVTLLRTLVDGYPAGHPGQISARTALAEALHGLFLVTDDGRLLAEAFEVARASVEVRAVPVRDRLRARATLGQVCGTRHDWEAARHWLTEAVRLLPRLAARELNRTDQQHLLAREHGLAAEAAAYALEAGRPEQALEVLEHGRGVLLGRLLRSRETDVALLRERAPALAERFVRLRDVEDPVPHRSDAYSAAGKRADAERMRTHEADWDELVGEVRSLPGMADFLRPPSAQEIIRRAGAGPVVVINISIRCDALIVADGTLDVVPLRITAEEVQHRVAGFLSAVDASTDGSNGTDGTDGSGGPGGSPGSGGLDGRLARQETVARTLEWLWDTITGPVLQRLAPVLRPGPGGTPARVWWCPQGPLAFLPLHAAGYHGPRADGGDERCVLARVASSYTSTVAALHHARTRRPGTGADGSGQLIVSMSRTPGAGDLPNADAEAHAVGRYLTNGRAAVSLADERATRDGVLEALRHTRSVHFACHAVADTQDPSACRILTHDHATRPLTVADVAGLRLDGAHLAYLSACATSATRKELVDEAVHITGAFQLAGFRHVVGTLWPVGDELAPELAAAFYAALAGEAPAATGASGARAYAGTDPRAEDDRVALALHATVAELHHRYAWFPSLWASHIHVGV
ncbi:tetratricopeptide (TPR) repeat protein [Streptomyces sp. 3330]|uniref:CHAT domain-containing tetratricopeptide repeat protein n=1 Tax=Streptomyces sp. 3330 TaxID=2817755 RepID=UPI00285F83AC|nr:CHAT domain-containing protein [Streptomyces sp. 3330]MDR6974088.1 tetratricopeptide (TPR) repeat protein [Streptomyces sp. 3330]